jgi:membrane-associated protease RseP (regulator of RpoE activity)
MYQTKPKPEIRQMTETPYGSFDANSFQQTDFDKITQVVSSEFQVEEALLDQGVPTYHLRMPQETKQTFLRLLQKLEEMKLIALLRRQDQRVVLTVFAKPPVKPSNPVTYWILFVATIATTFITGYVSFQSGGMDPILGGAVFSVAIMTVLGLHEMGHKLTANKRKVEATSPYFIPGPPPLGTLGAVIMQKSLPPNRDALFDIGANGPIAGFLVALVFSAVGLTLLIPITMPPDGSTLALVPVSWLILNPILDGLNLIPQLIAPYNAWALHPITWAGWAGMVVTMLNLLPAAMLDGGHVAKSMVPDKYRYLLTIASVAILVLSGQQFMFFAFIVVFMSFIKHPGPLDDVSSLSNRRKLATVALIVIFLLSFPIST